MAEIKPKRGEVWWVNFDPTKGSEVAKQRPAVIVSNDISNKYLDRVQVVPLTSNTDNIYPSECIVVLKQQKSKVMADQLRTVSIKRLSKKISVLSENDLQSVEVVLRLQLGL